jgi:hypothetical protein
MVATEIAKRLERGAKPRRSKRFAIPKNLIDIQYRRVGQQNLEARSRGLWRIGKSTARLGSSPSRASDSDQYA